jgi:dihydrolipoamide dehydrogenase
MEITVHELADIIHGHPSVSEALTEAAADCLGRCIHMPPKKK